jgi:PAS domain S-box-containing protein
MKLSIKLFIVIVIGAVLSIITASYFTFTYARDALENEIKTQQLQIATETMSKIDRFLYERFNDIKTVAGDHTVSRYLLAKEKKATITQAEQNEFLERINELSIVTGPWEIDIVDNNGNIIYSPNASRIGKNVQEERSNVAESTLFKKALDGATVYSDVIQDQEENGRPTMTFASVIRDEANPTKPIIGVTLAHLSWPVVVEILQSIPGGMVVDLYNKEGIEIGDNNPQNINEILKENKTPTLPISKRKLTQATSDIEKSIDSNQEVLASYVQEKGYLGYAGNGWTLHIETPTSVAFSPAINNALRIIFILIPILLCTNSLLFFFILRFLRPIEEMTKVTAEIAKGDLTKRVRVTTRDEIGKLAASFNNMTEKLQELYNNQEKTIQEKTAQLSEKVQDLEKTKTEILHLLEEQNIAKQKLEQEKAKDDAIITSIGDALIVVDNAAKIVMVNPSAEELLEKKLTEINNKPYFEAVAVYDEQDILVPPDKQPVHVALLQHSKESQSYIYKKSDKKVTITITATPIIQADKVQGVIAIIRDITKEREIDRMKTEFISLASHQLRTPLSAIKWFTEMLLSGDAGQLSQEQSDFARNISDSTERMIQLVNSLLNISRIESGRILIDPRPTDLKELVQGVVTDLKAKIEERHQNLIISVHEDLPKINIDPRLIRQVYMNLLTNAIKYTPKQGEITVFISKKDDEIISQVTDNGYGIPKSQQSRMFQKFFRAENVVKIETDGTGLGLYLIKAIIESSKGRIWFESEEGKGTTFWFSLPLAGMEAKKGEVTLDE